MEVLAYGFVYALQAYLAVGLLFAIPFVWKGAGQIDPVAREGTWGFRLIIIPGVIAMWPLLAARWKRKGARPIESNAHRRLAEERS